MAANDEPVFSDPTLLQKALERCRLRLESAPKDILLQATFADLHRKLGNLEEAGRAFARLASADSSNEEATYLAALLAGRDTPTPPAGIHAAPFVIYNNFLPSDLHEGLMPFVKSVQRSFRESRVGMQSEYQPEVRLALELGEQWTQEGRFKTLVDRLIPDVFARLHIAPFTVEPYSVRVRAYLDGHFFRVHQDVQPVGPGARRVINFVYYFHRLPKPYSGGDLVLFDSDIHADNTFTKARFTRIVPEDNSVIFFPSRFYHSVIPIHYSSGDFLDSRFVINAQISRPDEEPAVPDWTGNREE